ncbi:MAG: DegT/DnrJ/EryC1/StrS family aminotransferase [Lachnospiraceae bacterium]|nr:DegT/DnrJ/EryC1/StrS family aminotransferase [Lachnospiraceae bacterium]
MELGSNYDLRISELSFQDNNIKRYLENDSAFYVDSGRSAIKMLLPKIKKKKILLPMYICKSVVDCFSQGFEIQYYKLDMQLKINRRSLENLMDENVGMVYIMHYFGKLQEENDLTYIKQMQQRYHFFILEDTTHSFLTQKETIGDYQVCSLRKWFAVPDGGVLYTRNAKINQKMQLKENALSGKVAEAMILKNLYINKQVDCNDSYRKIFVEQEQKLDSQREICHISELTSVLLECMDYEEIAQRRKKNWDYLYGHLKNKKIKPMYPEKAIDFVPFVFPILTEERNAFRKYLIEHNIYCAIHWPIETEKQRAIEENSLLEQQILSLPIDQRYTEREIDYLIQVVNEW